MANRFDAEAGTRSVAPTPVSEFLTSKTNRPLMLLAALLLVGGLIWLIYRVYWVKAPVGNDRFGLCFISAPDSLADEARYSGALAAGARWDRWPLYWHWVAEGGYAGPHAGGQHDYDRLISQELAYGLTPTVILLGTPPDLADVEAVAAPVSASAQAAPPPKEDIAPPSTAILPPKSLAEPIFTDGTDLVGPGKIINPANHWAQFVFETVERYRPGGELAKAQGWPKGQGIRYWEIWNEPDYTTFWQGSVESYYRLLEVAYKSSKTADPEATIILGGLAFYEQADWLPQLLRQARGDASRAYFDVFSFHHYLSIYNSERLINQARTTLDSYGLTHVPIWITESGVSVWDDYPATTYDVAPTAPFRATLNEQAAYIIQNSALAFYNGVERYYHFMLHDDCGDGPSSAYGLRQNFTPNVCNPAEGNSRPAYAAYQLAAEQFQELQPLWREKQYEQDQVGFYRPGDYSRVVAMWATQGLTVTATLSATGETAQLYWIEAQKTISGVTGISRSLTLTPTAGVYTLTLPAATNQNSILANDPTYQIGGQPYLLVERDTQPPTVTLTALPPASSPDFLVQWQGEDRGSGIAGYEVWVSEDGRPLRRWLADTTATEAKYNGQVGHTYGFAIRARDRAGNESPSPTTAQITTQVVAGPAVTGVVLDPAGRPVFSATVTISGTNAQESLITDEDGLWPPTSLPGGDYSLNASAPTYGSWPAPRRVMITPPAHLTLTLAPPVNVISAGDFEGNGVWQVWEWPNGQITLSIDAFDGQAAVRLGEGAGEALPCPGSKQPGQLWTLQQPVTVPAEGTPLLSFLYKITTTQTIFEDAWLEANLIVGDRPHSLIPPGDLWQAPNWMLATADLSEWRGQEADIQFQVWRCSEQTLTVSLDRVSLGSPIP